MLLLSEDGLTPFSSEKLLHHLSQTVPAPLNLGEPGVSAKKPARKRTQAPDSIHLSRAAMRQVKAATLNRDYILKEQERLTATKDGPFMVPGSPPPGISCSLRSTILGGDNDRGLPPPSYPVQTPRMPPIFSQGNA